MLLDILVFHVHENKGAKQLGRGMGHLVQQPFTTFCVARDCKIYTALCLLPSGE